MVYTLEPRGLYAFEYPSFKEEWYYPVAPFLNKINFVDINGDGKVEIIAGSDAPCNTRQIGNTDDCHAYIYAATLEGKELWTKEIGRGYKRVGIAVADVDGDGNQEIVGGGWSFENNWGALFILDSEGNYIFGEEKEFDHSVFLLRVTDLENDGDFEILTATTSTLVLYDHSLREIRRQNFSMAFSENTRVIVNDIDADSEKEIILTSEDEKLLILNKNLEEEWSKTFPGYYKFPRVRIVNLNKCKNYLFVIADKLYAYTYSNNPDWPCIPWTITEQQKIAEAESHIREGDKCIDEENCECATIEFTLARDAYIQIQNEEGIKLVDERINTAKNCSNFKNSLEEAKRLFGEADETLHDVYISDQENYLTKANNLLSEIETNLNEAKIAYEVTWKEESEEVKEYSEKVEKIKSAVETFDEGRKRNDVTKLQEAISIFHEYEWSEHVDRIENMIFSISQISENGLSTLEKLGALSGIIGVIITILIFIYQERIKKYLSRKKTDSSSEQDEQSLERETDSSFEYPPEKETSGDREKTKEDEGLTEKIIIEQKEVQEKFYEQQRKETEEIDEIEENNDRIEEIEEKQKVFPDERKTEILDFRSKRTQEIKIGDNMPVPLNDTAKIVLHIAPFNAFSQSIKFDLTSLTNKDLPLLCGSQNDLNHEYSPDNLLIYRGNPQKFVWSYVQVLDNGIIEAVDTHLLNISDKHIPLLLIEDRLLDTLRRHRLLQKQLGVEPPLFMMLSYLGVRGYKVYQPIEEDDLLTSEVVIESFECSIFEVLKPVFNEIRKAFGFHKL